jgi:hypothetical protein
MVTSQLQNRIEAYPCAPPAREMISETAWAESVNWRQRRALVCCQGELVRPVARLREFGGGFVSPSVAREIGFRMLRLGLTQSGLGALIGRCQGHAE